MFSRHIYTTYITQEYPQYTIFQSKWEWVYHHFKSCSRLNPVPSGCRTQTIYGILLRSNWSLNNSLALYTHIHCALHRPRCSTHTNPNTWPCKLTFKGLYTDHRSRGSTLFLFYAQKKDIQRQIRAPMTRLLKTTVEGDFSLKPLPLSMSRVQSL